MTPPVSSLRVADVLTVNLRTVFDNLCVHRYGGPVSLERTEAPDPDPATARFRLHRTGLPDLRVAFAIRHVGGNVYDLHGAIEDGPDRTFTYSLPESNADRVPRAPFLAHEVASFLLDALEQRVGNDLLRTEMRGRRQPSEPERLVPRTPPASGLKKGAK
jgi:hypothetical protein